MSKLVKHADGSMSYDSSNGKPVNEPHYCPYARVINLVDKRMNGDEDSIGIFSDVKTIVKNQEANKLWLRGSVFAFSTLILLLIYVGITDHNKIQDFPRDYLSKQSLNGVISELKQQTVIMTRIVNSPNIDSLLFYRKELNELQQNSEFDRMRATTRSGDASTPTKRDSIYREKMTEKAKEYLNRK